jgi:hypothetical protein
VDFDKAEILVLSATVGPEHALVTLGHDRKTAILVRRDWPLELFGAAGIDNQAARGHHPPIDPHIGNTAQWTVVPQPQGVNLTRPRQYVTGAQFPHAYALPSRHYLDGEISSAHDDLPDTRCQNSSTSTTVVSMLWVMVIGLP